MINLRQKVIGVRVGPASCWWRRVAVNGIDEGDELRRRPKPVGSTRDGLQEKRHIVIVGNAARHVEQPANGHLFPGWILWKPAAQYLRDVERSRGFELQKRDGGGPHHPGQPHAAYGGAESLMKRTSARDGEPADRNWVFSPATTAVKSRDSWPQVHS